MMTDELLAAYAEGQRYFPFTYLRDANLSRADLRDAYLRGANLSRADLRDAYLRDAYLRSANLRGANLSRADLRGANLSSANLRSANLRSADLRGANLGDADLRGANLICAYGIYSAFALHMSSRTDALTGHIDIVNDAIVLMISAGCWLGTPEEFRRRIAGKKTDAEGKQYLATLAFIEVCFENDMANNMWDYLPKLKDEEQAS